MSRSAGAGKASPPSTSTAAGKRSGWRCRGQRRDEGAHRVSDEHRGRTPKTVAIEVRSSTWARQAERARAPRGCQAASAQVRARGTGPPRGRGDGPARRRRGCHDEAVGRDAVDREHDGRSVRGRPTVRSWMPRLPSGSSMISTSDGVGAHLDSPLSRRAAEAGEAGRREVDHDDEEGAQDEQRLRQHAAERTGDGSRAGVGPLSSTRRASA